MSAPFDVRFVKPRLRISIAESDCAVAFRDRYPVAQHHSLVIPRRQVVSLFELDANELPYVWAVVNEHPGTQHRVR